MGSAVSRLLRDLSEIYLPGGSFYSVNPLALIALFFTISALLYLMNPLMLLATYALSIITLLLIRGCKVMFKLLMYSIVFLAPYTVSAVFVQLFAGLTDPVIIFVSCLRMQILIYLSVMMVSLLDTVSIVRFFSRLSPSLGLVLAMTLKAIYVFSICGAHVSEIYSVNLRGLGRARRLFPITRATTNLSLHTMFYIIEAFYTRRHVISGRVRVTREKSKSIG